MTTLAEIICGTGCVPDWNAISAVATAAAVVVALWIPARERSARNLEKRENEARAAEIVGQSLVSIIDLFPRVIEEIRRTDGALLDCPGSNVLYGIDACRELIEREAFCYQLPSSYIGLGTLVSSLARKWCAEISVRLETQRNTELRALVNWREHGFTCHLGEQLYEQALGLRNLCADTQVLIALQRLSWFRRALRWAKRLI